MVIVQMSPALPLTLRRNAIRRPSGAKVGNRSDTVVVVSWMTPVPSARISNRS